MGKITMMVKAQGGLFILDMSIMSPGGYSSVA